MVLIVLVPSLSCITSGFRRAPLAARALQAVVQWYTHRNSIVTIGWSRPQATLAVDRQPSIGGNAILLAPSYFHDFSARFQPKVNDQVLIKEIFYENRSRCL